MIFWEIVAGVLGGIVAGMGMGGGTLTTPILTIFLKYEQLRAQGVNLIAFLPMSIIAIIIHIKNRLISIKGVWIVALSGLVVSVGASFLAGLIDDKILGKCFGIFLIILSFCEVIKLNKK